jgi:hypothetical protein
MPLCRSPSPGQWGGEQASARSSTESACSVAGDNGAAFGDIRQTLAPIKRRLDVCLLVLLFVHFTHHVFPNSCGRQAGGRSEQPQEDTKAGRYGVGVGAPAAAEPVTTTMPSVTSARRCCLVRAGSTYRCFSFRSAMNVAPWIADSRANCRDGTVPTIARQASCAELSAPSFRSTTATGAAAGSDTARPSTETQQCPCIRPLASALGNTPKTSSAGLPDSRRKW